MRPRKVIFPHYRFYITANIERVLIPTLHSLPFSNDRISFCTINPIAEILSLPGEKYFFVETYLGIQFTESLNMHY